MWGEINGAFIGPSSFCFIYLAGKFAEVPINNSLYLKETNRAKASLLAYFFRLPPTLEDEYVSIDVLHTDPAGQAQGRVCPHPVHHGPQLRQKRDEAEPSRNHVLLQGPLWDGPPITWPTPRAHGGPGCFSPYNLEKILKVTIMVKSNLEYNCFSL